MGIIQNTGYSIIEWYESALEVLKMNNLIHLEYLQNLSLHVKLTIPVGIVIVISIMLLEMCE